MTDLFHSSNAMVFNFMTDGIPIVYYGQEQLFSGGSDPVCFLAPTSRNCILTGA